MGLNTLYMMVYSYHQPHWDPKRNKLEIFNEVIILTLSYHMVTFSDFNLNVDTMFVMGYSFISFMMLMILVNTMYLIVVTVQKWRTRKAYKQKGELMCAKAQLAQKIMDKKNKKEKKSKSLKDEAKAKKVNKQDLDNIIDQDGEEWDTRVKVVDLNRYNKIVKQDKSQSKTLQDALAELDSPDSKSTSTSASPLSKSLRSSPSKKDKKDKKSRSKSHKSALKLDVQLPLDTIQEGDETDNGENQDVKFRAQPKKNMTTKNVNVQEFGQDDGEDKL
jgi:formiminotetrahydrofolate cyclodeaminase